MSLNHSILTILNLKDENITFDKKFASDEVVKGVTSKVFYAKLTYRPRACYNCGHTFDINITKYGFSKPSMIKLPKVSGFNTYLKLKKQRYFCLHCNCTFILKSNIVNKNCFISNNTKAAIALNAKDKISEKDIARNHNVSHSTVNRIVNSFYTQYKPTLSYLPKHLCFDEFKSVKSASGAMSFIFSDSDSGQIVDIVEDRRLNSLRNYFSKYNIDARRSVETIVIDMYSPYISVIKEMFPKAKIIIDRFHIIQLLTRSLNKTRIKVMNNDKKNYNKLKKYWKLLLKDRSKVDYTKYRYSRSFRRIIRDIDIVDALLDLDPQLKATYDFYQKVRYLIQTKNLDLLKDLILNNQNNVSNYMKTSIKTLKKYLPYIENSLHYNYTNGTLEGINNKIKVIKRISFGYRSFDHLKNRILITQNLVGLKSA